MDPKELIQSLVNDLARLAHRDEQGLDALQKRAQMITAKIFGDSSKYLQELGKISFHPGIAYRGMPDQEYDRGWQQGRSEFQHLCGTMIEDLALSQELTPTRSSEPGKETQSMRVFIVHGHDDEMKQSVARALEKLGLTPVILHEQPDLSRTVIEKFEAYADVEFAVVLLSPDDLAFPKTGSAEDARLRARQNVVLELGFFLGKLGRRRVIALHRPAANFEMPSDYAGVLFKPYDPSGSWKMELVKELGASGYNVDASRLF